MAALQGLSDRIVLETSTFTLGRAPDNQIVLSDGKVSSHHAVLQLLGEEYSITDLGSSNGTYINEARLPANTPVTLQNGNTIRIGDTAYTYEGNRQVASGHEPTMLASSPSPSYEATMLASPPQAEFSGQTPPATPSYPEYPATVAASSAMPPQAYPQQQGSGYSSPEYPATVAASSATPPQAYPQQQGSGYPPAYPQQQADPYAQQGQSYQPPQGGYSSGASYAPVSQPGLPSYPQAGQPGQPYQQSWGGVPPSYPQPTPPKRGAGLKIAIVVLVILLILGGGGTAYYILSRPQPTITVTSQYTVNSTPAGANGTEITVSGQKFSGSSAITFLLDGSPVAGASATSDSQGAFSATLKITEAWSVGNHTLTAKDASGYVTEAKRSLTIVTAGQAHTPGPNGAPSDDVSGKVDANVVASDGTEAITLNITGKTDGGTVCRDIDDGQPHQKTGTSSGLTYVETAVATCEGTYKGGKLTYTETITSDRVEFEGGYVCETSKPYVSRHLEGAFSDKTTLNGTFSSDEVTVNCNKGLGSSTTDASQGTWTGTWTAQ